LAFDESCSGLFAGADSTCSENACDVFAGDTCEWAFVVETGSHAFDTSNATNSGYEQPTDWLCPGTYLTWNYSPDNWFMWTAEDDGEANFNTCDVNSYDTSLVLYEGADCGSLVMIACNGDADSSSGCQEYSSDITVSVTSGQTYFVRIGGYQASTGPGTLNIELEVYVPPCPGDLGGSGGVPDGMVNIHDLLVLIGAWGGEGGDLNDDGITNIHDLLILVGAWGTCP
jgi:hypothetical protein